MFTLKKFIAVVSFMLCLTALQAQTASTKPATTLSGIQTATFTVAGTCDQCKARIENAADIKGVKLCTWDPNTQIAKVTYNASKVSLEQIQKAIAAAGHDAGPIKATDAAYKELPGCCQYHSQKVH